MPATTKSEFFATLLCDIGIRSPAAFAVTVPVREIFPRLEKSRAATGSVDAHKNPEQELAELRSELPRRWLSELRAVVAQQSI